MIMTTFLESRDFTGKTVHPFFTHAVSGLGRTEAVYSTALRGARLQPGLAVPGREAGAHRADVETWLAQSGLTPYRAGFLGGPRVAGRPRESRRHQTSV